MRPPHLWFALLLSGLAVGCSSDQDVRRILRPPEVAIVHPEPLQAFRQGEGPLPFAGTVSDTYDAPSALEVRWSLDGEELPAEPRDDGTVLLPLEVDGLALGEHVLGLWARDQDQQEASVEVPWILQGALDAPVVTIETPVDPARFLLGEEITFRGTAFDNNTSGDALTFRWSSSLDGSLDGAISGDGQSVLFRSDLSLGIHLVTLEGMDVDGLVGSDTVEVTIAEPEPEPEEPVEEEPVEEEPEPVEAEVGDLVFSELMVNPSVVADELGEWVELYNTSGSPIELAGYSFHDLDTDSYVLGSLLIAPGDYVVLCANTDLATNGGIPCDGLFVRATGGPGAMALGNSGDEVVLSRPDGTVIDEVLYEGSWFTPGLATGLDPAQISASNNDDETMWCDQTTVLSGASEPGTPGQVNDPC
jgi:hypothetical protein